MNSRSHLKTHHSHSEQGVVLVIVSLLLVVISWVASDLYIQSTLVFKMVMNVDKAIQQQIKAEQEIMQILEEREAALNQYWIEDPKTYLEKYHQRYVKEMIGVLPESFIAQAQVDKYQITYAIPFEINKRRINLQILSWSKIK